jgi:hypothetical protein
MEPGRQQTADADGDTATDAAEVAAKVEARGKFLGGRHSTNWTNLGIDLHRRGSRQSSPRGNNRRRRGCRFSRTQHASKPPQRPAAKPQWHALMQELARYAVFAKLSVRRRQSASARPA